MKKHCNYARATPVPSTHGIISKCGWLFFIHLFHSMLVSKESIHAWVQVYDGLCPAARRPAACSTLCPITLGDLIYHNFKPSQIFLTSIIIHNFIFRYP